VRIDAFPDVLIARLGRLPAGAVCCISRPIRRRDVDLKAAFLQLKHALRLHDPLRAPYPLPYVVIAARSGPCWAVFALFSFFMRLRPRPGWWADNPRRCGSAPPRRDT